MVEKQNIIGVLLAGGKGRRMGSGSNENNTVDKCLLPLGYKPILQHVINRAAPQVDQLILNINGDKQRFKSYPLTTVYDIKPGYHGPLMGIVSAMQWAREQRPQCQWLASFATDTPFFPLDLVEKLSEAVQREQTPLACARCEGRSHPTFSLWSLSIYDELTQFLLGEEQRKMQTFLQRYSTSWVEFPNIGIDPFFNINTPEDLKACEQFQFGN